MWVYVKETLLESLYSFFAGRISEDELTRRFMLVLYKKETIDEYTYKINNSFDSGV